VRQRAWIAIALLVAGLAVSWLSNASDNRVVAQAGGALLVSALLVALTMLPGRRFLPRVLPRIEPMTGLFERPRSQERWCIHCGQPTKAGACQHCGAEPKAQKRSLRAKAEKKTQASNRR
jgi:uncharacterized paraquat-inducible protein A